MENDQYIKSSPTSEQLQDFRAPPFVTLKRLSSCVLECFFEQLDLCFADGGYVNGDFQGTRDRNPAVRLFLLDCLVQKVRRSVQEVLSVLGLGRHLFRSKP